MLLLCLNQPASNPQVSITAGCGEMGIYVLIYGAHICAQVFYKGMWTPVFHGSKYPWRATLSWNKSNLVKHLALAWFSTSPKAGKVPAEIRVYVAVLESLNQRALPHRGWHKEASKPHFSTCSSISIQTWLSCRPPKEWHARQESFLLDYQFPLKMLPWQAGDPSHQSAFMQALP